MSTITLKAASARYLAEALLPAVSKDDVTPVLTGIHLTIEEGKLRGVSTDRYRVHAVLLDLVEPAEDLELNALVPRDAVQWLARNAGAYVTRRHSPFDSTVTLDIADESLTITVRQDAAADDYARTLTTPLIKGKFPPVIGLIDKARKAETTDGPISMQLDFLASSKALAAEGLIAPVMRFTKGDGKGPGPVHLRYGQTAEALIQPILR
ncbi:MAG: hypothetical protein K0S49_41 [Microbacterium sp.]|jgi:DNA polymerase III sliding clamp (beta) subunit (PCNA family)|nr:hypothetical protein [Microbacterium sp.]